MDKPLADRDFRRILIIKPSSIGDVVHALPMLEAVRAHWPAAHLAWLVAPPCADIIRSNRMLNEVILFDRAEFGHIGRNWSATRSFLVFLRDLRGRRFDLVIDAQGLFRSAFLCAATGAGVRLGFTPVGEFAWMFYTHRSPRDMRLHAVDRMMRLVAWHGVPEIERRFRIELEPVAERNAATLLKNVGLEPPARFAAVVPGARWETKRWPWQRYAALVDGMAAKLELPSVLLGSRQEQEICRRVSGAAWSQPADLCGRTDLQTVAAVLKRAAVVVCNDSGASMHLAAALNRPLIAVFGPTNPQRTGPYGALDSVVSAGVPCAPCYLRHASQCPYAMRCMDQVTVEMMLDRVRQAI